MPLILIPGVQDDRRTAAEADIKVLMAAWTVGKTHYLSSIQVPEDYQQERDKLYGILLGKPSEKTPCEKPSEPCEEPSKDLAGVGGSTPCIRNGNVIESCILLNRDFHLDGEQVFKTWHAAPIYQAIRAHTLRHELMHVTEQAIAFDSGNPEWLWPDFGKSRQEFWIHNASFSWPEYRAQRHALALENQANVRSTLAQVLGKGLAETCRTAMTDLADYLAGLPSGEVVSGNKLVKRVENVIYLWSLTAALQDCTSVSILDPVTSHALYKDSLGKVLQGFGYTLRDLYDAYLDSPPGEYADWLTESVENLYGSLNLSVVHEDGVSIHYSHSSS